MSDERIVPTTPKGEEPKQAPPRRRRNRARVAAAALVAALVVVVAVGFVVNGLPGRSPVPAVDQERTIAQESVEGDDAAAEEASAQDEATSSESAATQDDPAESQQGVQSQPAAPSSNSNSTSLEEPSENAIHVHITVTADPDAAAKLSGYPQVSTDVVLTDDQTPYGALAATGLAIGGSRTYVSSIGGLREKALGGTSGWMYLVNGVQVMKPAGSYQLSDGDNVYWHFVDTW